MIQESQHRSLAQISVKKHVTSDATQHVQQAVQHVHRSRGCKITETITMPDWLAKVLGTLVDVELFCNFPSEEYVNTKIANIESTIVKRSGSLRIQPGANISYLEVPS